MTSKDDKIHPLVSIVIVNYKNINDTLECIESAKKTDYPNFEIIVIDNGSKDGSEEELQRVAGINLIINSTNLGAVEARRIGALKAAGKYVVNLDNDTVVDPDWLTPLVEIMESDSKIAICVGTVHFYNERKNRRQVEERVKTLKSGGMTILGYPSNRFNLLNSYEEAGINIGAGSAFIFKKGLFADLLPAYYFIGYEDTFLAWLSILSGFKNRRSSKTFVWHKEANAKIKNNIRYKIIYYDERNRLLNLFYFYGGKTLFLILPLLLIDEIKKILINLLIKSWKDTKSSMAYFSSRLWIFLNIPFIIKQRKIIQSMRKITDTEIYPLIEKRMYQKNSYANRALNYFSIAYCKKVGIG